MSIFKNDPTSKLQTELARLEKKRATLAGGLVAAESAAAAAQEARRRHLIESDDIDASAGVEFSEAVDAAQRDMTAISGATAELDKLIEEGRAAIVAAKESADRARRAAEISAKITKLDPMIATAESLFDKLTDVLAKIIDTAEDRDLILREYSALKGPGAPLPAITLASAALAEALFKSIPDGFAVTMSPTRTFAAASLPLMIRRDGGLSGDLPLDDETGQGFRPLPLSGALTENVINPLRTAAAEILNGARPLAKASTVIDDEGDDAEPVFDWKWLVFIKPATWTDWRGETVTQADSRAMVPDPVARAALAAGVAVPENSPEAQTHENWRYEKGFNHSAVAMGKDVVTLDVRWPAPGRMAA